MILSPFAFSAHENPPHAYKGFKWQVFIYIQFSVMNNLKWFHVKYQIHLETLNEDTLHWCQILHILIQIFLINFFGKFFLICWNFKIIIYWLCLIMKKLWKIQ